LACQDYIIAFQVLHLAFKAFNMASQDYIIAFQVLHLAFKPFNMAFKAFPLAVPSMDGPFKNSNARSKICIIAASHRCSKAAAKSAFYNSCTQKQNLVHRRVGPMPNKSKMLRIKCDRYK
jgi:hypothetical protein